MSVVDGEKGAGLREMVNRQLQRLCHRNLPVYWRRFVRVVLEYILDIRKRETFVEMPGAALWDDAQGEPNK